MSKAPNLELVNSILQIGTGNAHVKADGTGLAARTAGDAGYAVFKVADAVADQDAVNKGQLDAAIEGLDWKPAVVAATTTAGTLASDFENGDVIDGVTLATGNRILIKDQASGVENGIYEVQASGAPSRVADLPAASSANNVVVTVGQGTANGDQSFRCTNNSGSDVVGTDALVWANFTSGVSSIASAGTGVSLVKTGSGNAVLNDVANGSQIAANLAADLITFSIVAGTVDTAELANDAVTEAKVAALAGMHFRRVTLSYTTQGTPQNIGSALPTNAVAMFVMVKVGTAFTDSGTHLDVGRSGAQTELMDGSLIDPTDTTSPSWDLTDIDESGNQLTALIDSSTNTAGEATFTVGFIVTS